MDVDTLVMTAATRLGIYATAAETVTGPIAGSQLTVIECVDQADAQRLAFAFMAENVAAESYGKTVLILHPHTWTAVR